VETTTTVRPSIKRLNQLSNIRGILYNRSLQKYAEEGSMNFVKIGSVTIIRYSRSNGISALLPIFIGRSG